MSNLAGNPNGPSLTFAGVTFTDLNSLIFIEGKVTVSGSPPYYTTVRRINGAAAAAYMAIEFGVFYDCSLGRNYWKNWA